MNIVRKLNGCQLIFMCECVLQPVPNAIRLAQLSRNYSDMPIGFDYRPGHHLALHDISPVSRNKNKRIPR
jgi:hypothetical protein